MLSVSLVLAACSGEPSPSPQFIATTIPSVSPSLPSTEVLRETVVPMLPGRLKEAIEAWAPLALPPQETGLVQIVSREEYFAEQLTSGEVAQADLSSWRLVAVVTMSFQAPFGLSQPGIEYLLDRKSVV